MLETQLGYCLAGFLFSVGCLIVGGLILVVLVDLISPRFFR